jgi:hypothetical protein
MAERMDRAKLWRRRNRESPQLDAWLASRLLDEALRVFGMLEACTFVSPAIGEELQELLTLTARGILDDVAYLAGAAAAAPLLRSWPRDPSEPPPDELQPLVCRAVDDLATYTRRLAAIATVLTRRGADAAPLFSQLAATAEERMTFLAS